MVEQRNKKNSVSFATIPVALPGVKNEESPAAEFEQWCTTTLSSWETKIDVAIFYTFLRDVDSPNDVKEYVRGYLGETKDAKEFARQFIERRSKILRVGIDTHSDDLSAPAAAVNPRLVSKSDYQHEWKGKGKGKKSKKNKMKAVDAEILGFCSTAAEERTNKGEIVSGRHRRYQQDPPGPSSSQQ